MLAVFEAETEVSRYFAVPLRDYLCRVALEAGLTLACALPFVLIAAWRARTRRWGLLLFVASLVVVSGPVCLAII